MSSHSGSTTPSETKSLLQAAQSSLHSVKSLSRRRRISGPAELQITGEQILAKYNTYGLLNEATKDEELVEEKLKHIDGFEMLHDVEALAYHLGGLELENRLYTNYLESNSPEMLSLADMQKAQQQQHISTPWSTSSGNVNGKVSFSMRRSQRASARNSLTSAVNSQRSTSKRSNRSVQLPELLLNARTKATLAERAVGAVKQRLAELEQRGTRELKWLRARYAALQAQMKDTNQLMSNFNLHFYRDSEDLQFLNFATELQLQKRFIKFTKDFFRTARTLTGVLRLTVNSLANTCENTEILLVEKRDLFGSLCEADYELLPMQLTQARKTVKDRRRILRGMQNAAVRTEICLMRQMQHIEKIEAQIVHTERRNIEIGQNIARLLKETEAVRQTNAKERGTLQNMRQMHAEYMAPSVSSYVELKEVCNMLEKQEKMLQRKIAIARMKLKNMHICAKQQRQSKETVKIVKI